MSLSPLEGIALAIGTLLLMQSCTVSMPIEGRVVDGRTGRPVAGARVHAIWRTTVATLAGSLPGSVIRQRSTTTDDRGRYRIGPGVALHWPVFPFSLHLRIGMYLPLIEASAEGYETRKAVNDYWSPYGFITPHGVLFLRWSSWNARDLRLTARNASSFVD